MSKYRITLIAEGPHHLGHTTGNLEKDADHLAKLFIQMLETRGHKISLATFHHGETTDILVGSPYKIEPEVKESSESPVLSEIQTGVASLIVKVEALAALFKKQAKPAQEKPQPPKKIEGGGPEAKSPEASTEEKGDPVPPSEKEKETQS